MDTIFNCPACNQQISADESAVGVEIACPACGEIQLIPPAKPLGEPTPAPAAPPAPEAPAAPPAAGAAPHAPAAESKHKALTLPVRGSGDGSEPKIITKKGMSENAARPRVKCFKYAECFVDGRNQFEEMVAEFLLKRQEGLSAIHPISYGFVNEAGQVIPDFGVMIFYKG